MKQVYCLRHAHGVILTCDNADSSGQAILPPVCTKTHMRDHRNRFFQRASDVLARANLEAHVLQEVSSFHTRHRCLRFVLFQSGCLPCVQVSTTPPVGASQNVTHSHEMFRQLT
jgi:hypothetical protein